MWKGMGDMRKEFKPVTIEEIEDVWHGANFGPELNKNKMNVVKGALLKWACGYTTGHTAYDILVDLGLLTERKNLTVRGKKQLWEFFKDLPRV